MSRNNNCICEICEIGLYRRPSELKKYKHVCCVKCRSKLIEKYKNEYKRRYDKNFKKGRTCWKGKYKKDGYDYSFIKPRSGGEKDKIVCKVCKKKFIVYKHYNRKFCGRECYYVDRKNKKSSKLLVRCKNCGKLVKKFPCRVKKSKNSFCSFSCNSIYKIKIQKHKNTDIEIILKKWLNDNNIKYTFQKNILNKTVVDFFIKPNICLYADGDYWHSLKQWKQRDKKINKLLKNNNYKVIRLKGSEIHAGKRPMQLLG